MRATRMLLAVTAALAAIGLAPSAAHAADYTFAPIVSCPTPMTTVAGWAGFATRPASNLTPANMDTSQSGYPAGTAVFQPISGVNGTYFPATYGLSAPYEPQVVEYGGSSGSQQIFDVTLADAVALQFAFLDIDVEAGWVIGYNGTTEVKPVLVPSTAAGSVTTSFTGNQGNYAFGGPPGGNYPDLDERAVLQVGFTTPVDRIRVFTQQGGGSMEMTNLAGCQSADVIKSATAPALASATATEATFTSTITTTLKNTAPSDTGLRLYRPSMTDDLAAALGGTPAPTSFSVSGLSSSTTGGQSAGACTVNGSYDGSADTALLAAGATDYLDPQATCTVTFTLTVTYPRTATGFTKNNTITVDAAGTGTQQTDSSTDGTTLPTTAKGDTASPTPLVFPPATSELTLTKTADPTTIAAAGEVVTYSFLLENTGALTLTDLAVTDTLAAPAGPELTVTCPVTTLAAGEQTTCTASYTATQADVDHGVIDNSAVASGDDGISPDPIQSNTSTAQVTAPADPAITLDKRAGTPSGTTAGSHIAYQFVVTNTGNVTLDPISVADAKVGTVTCPVTSLAPAGSTTCTATYTLTQADVDAGVVNNTATVTGTAPDGETTVTATDSLSTPIAGSPAIRLDKRANKAGPVHVGDKITYTFVATNTGNVTLTGVVVKDPMLGTVTCTKTTLRPGESTKCHAKPYRVTAKDVRAGKVVNHATTRGTYCAPVVRDRASSKLPAGCVAVTDTDTVKIKTAAVGTGSGGLPSTGNSVRPWVAGLAGLMTVLGLGLVFGGRRRRSANQA